MSTATLPQGWVEYADSTTEGTLVFAKLSIDLSLLTTSATFLVKEEEVNEELNWTLSCHGVQVDTLNKIIEREMV